MTLQKGASLKSMVAASQRKRKVIITLSPVDRTRCDYPDCSCAVSFPKGYRPSVATECSRAQPDQVEITIGPLVPLDALSKPGKLMK